MDGPGLSVRSLGDDTGEGRAAPPRRYGGALTSVPRAALRQAGRCTTHHKHRRQRGTMMVNAMLMATSS